MSDINFPIDSSDLRSIIPPEEDIIYDTYMKANLTSGKKKIQFISHFLMTENGFYWTNPEQNSISLSFPLIILHRQNPELLYSDWIDIKDIEENKIRVGSTDHFTLFRNDEMETEEDHAIRVKAFALKMWPNVIVKCTNWLNQYEYDLSITNKKKNGVRKKLKRANKKYDKAKKEMGI